MKFRRIASDAGISALRKVISVLSGIIVIPIITKLIGEGAYGIWATLLAVIGLAASAGGMHLHGSLIRYSQTDPNKQVLADTFALSAIAAGMITVVFAATAYAYERTFGFASIPQTLLLPAALIVGLKILENVLINYPRAIQRVKLFELLITIRTLARTIGVVLAFWWFVALTQALWAYVLVTVLFNLVLFIVFGANSPSLPEPSNFAGYLRYGLPMVPKELASSLVNNSDKFLLLFFLGPVPTGIYAVAKSVTSVFPSLSGVFDSTLYPNVSAAWEAGDFDELRIFYSTFLRWYSILVIPAIVGLSLLAFPLLRFISTAKIAEQGAMLIPILAFAFSLQGLEFSLTYPLAAAEKTNLIGGITVVAVIANLGLNLVLIPTVGIIGAAFATVVAFAIRSGLLFYYADSLLDISFPTKGFRDCTVATLVMITGLFVLPVNSWFWKLVFYPMVGIVIFGLSFTLISGFTREEREFIREKVSGLSIDSS
jgi:O-antigen/teichoic acid export membrane protein